MAGLPYTQTRQDTPESIVDSYLQRGLQDIQQRFEFQWNEVNSRAKVLGQRRQMELLSELQAKATQEMMVFNQKAQQQMDQLQRIDRLAQQADIDPYEPKMRAVLGPEEEMARFPKERSIAAQFGELDIYEGRLKQDKPDFLTDPGGKRIKDPWKWWWQEKKTRPMLKVYDPTINPRYDKKKEKWVIGDYRVANQVDIRQGLLIDRELERVRQAKRELMRQPDVATRIRGAALRIKRDPEHTSFDTKVQQSKPAPRREVQPKQKVIRQRNTRTGQERISYDNGRTWQIVSK